MDHSKHTPLLTEDVIEMDLQGVNIYGPEDSHIGDVSHTHGAGLATEVIVDVGGFLGIGAKRVSIPVNKLNFMRDKNEKIHATTLMTKDQLKNLPEHQD